MARPESRIKAGYLPIEEHHYPAILSLLKPGSPDHRLLDPFAGEGEFLQAAAQAWNLTPYANELDDSRAALCAEKFGMERAVQGDVERLSASNAAFSVGWYNPPYDGVSGETKDNRRLEFKYLKHAWKWIVPQGVIFWAVYQSHLTDIALKFFSNNSTDATIWGLPGLHQGEYAQVIVAAIKGSHPRPDDLLARLNEQRDNPCPLTVQTEPIYTLPPVPKLERFYFAPDEIDAPTGARLIERAGAWANSPFQVLLQTPMPLEPESPIVSPRPGHLALTLAGGLADGAVLDSPTYGAIAIRGKTVYEEKKSGETTQPSDKNGDYEVKTVTIRRKPSTTLTLLGGDGTITELNGDEAQIAFITEHQRQLTDYLQTRLKPQYSFDLNGLGGYLGKLRLNGKYRLYPAQQHVVAAIVKGFETRKGILLAAQMGAGKTAMGGGATLAMMTGQALRLAKASRPDAVTLVVSPPQLLKKWQREVGSLHHGAYIQIVETHEQLHAFMKQATKIGDIAPKIMVVRRDMTKLDSGHAPAVVWKTRHTIHWKRGTPTPQGYRDDERVTVRRLPTCPHCGNVVTMSKDEPASADWLQSGQRNCDICHHPLWQEQRMPSGKLRPRLDEVLKRRYPDRIGLLIWDEAHEAANADRGNGEAFARLNELADYTLAMTGTPFNGYASSLFNIEYCLNRRVKQRYALRGSDRLKRKSRGSQHFPERTQTLGYSRGEAEALWVKNMGVLEKTLTTSPEFDAESGAFTGTATYERPYREAAGIAPALAGELLDHTLFLSLSDFGQALPKYEEQLIGVDLDADIDDAYREINSQLKDYLKANRAGPDSTGFNSFMGAYQAWALSWQDMPFLPTTVIHNKRVRGSKQRVRITVATAPLFEANRVYAKEQQLLDLLTEELAAGRPCVVFLRETKKNDLQPRLAQLIGQHVPKAIPFILHSKVNPAKREELIADQLAQGMNVLISNPELIKTGLDIVEMPTLIFYQPIYNLSTMLQASARAYRLNQTRDCKTIYLYTQGTMEETAVRLMSRKQRAGKLLLGASGVTGLDALTEGDGGGLEEALRVMLLNDTTLVDTRTAFAKPVEAEIQLEQADLNYWNTVMPPVAKIETVPVIPTVTTPPIEEKIEDIPAITRVDISPSGGDSDPLLATILEMGGTVRTEPNHRKSRADEIPKKIATPKATPAPKASPQRRRKSKPSLLDLPDEPTAIKTPLPIPATPANAPVQLTLF